MADNNKKLRPSFALHVYHFEKGCTLHNFIPDYMHGCHKELGAGDFPCYYACDSRLLSLENRRTIEPKEIPSCLIPHVLVVFTHQIEILVTALLSK